MTSAVDITVFTIEEAAPMLKIAPKTLRRWLREGTFPGVKIGRKWLVRADDVEHALAHGRRGDHAVWVPDEDASPEMPPPEAQAPVPVQPPAPIVKTVQRPLTGVRRPIVEVLRAHPEGLTPAQVQTQLGTDKPLRDTMKNMLREGLLRRPGTGAYGVYVVADEG